MPNGGGLVKTRDVATTRIRMNHKFGAFTGFNHRQENAQTLEHLRKESMDLYNRIHSISEDIAFVNVVTDHYPDFPLIPNLRCGAWYANHIEEESAYFKSTDGHFRSWAFNLRRPNLHLLPSVRKHNGIIVVDSTRAGKRIPDALSKTVPIWCAVINRAILHIYRNEIRGPWDTSLYTPPGAVSPQEHDQIENRLDEWAESLIRSSYELPHLSLPLRPLWITPATSMFPKLSDSSFLPVLCLSASKQTREGAERRSNGHVYIQGAGDDHELWGMGLTPELFWKHSELLLKATRTNLPDHVKSIVSNRSHTSNRVSHSTPVVMVAGHLLLCCIAEMSLPSPYQQPDPWIDNVHIAYLLIVTCEDRPEVNSVNVDVPYPVMRIYTRGGKRGHVQFLQVVLPQAMGFIRNQLEAGSRVCIACETGKDLSVGVALAALQMFFDDKGHFVKRNSSAADKQSIRTRLQWIISSRPQANPSRTTLKRVNEFLLTSFRSMAHDYSVHSLTASNKA